MTNPASVTGAWRRGWTVDAHTVSSQFTGYNEQGHPQFETERSELGELLYQLKYRSQQGKADLIAEILSEFLATKPKAMSRVDIVVPVPPSTKRDVQPVSLIASKIAEEENKIAVLDAVRKVKETNELKGVESSIDRKKMLNGAFEANADSVKGKGVLLVDDLYRSGSTANAVTESLIKAGADPVYFLAATRTRSNT